MKKLVILLSIIFLVTGCRSINKLSTDEVINTFAIRPSKTNTIRTGYNYYLPQGMQVVDSTLYNEVIEDDLYSYYLYVDVVSYYNKVSKNYDIKSNSYYSKRIYYEDKVGYAEINLLENDKYLVEIMYNYAKIEVIVDKDKCNEAMISAINILKSIEYNDNIIANLLGDDILKFYEEEFDIFSTKGDDNTPNGSDEVTNKKEDEVPDLDLIN